MAGEYGTNQETGGLGRPHFHALLFGFEFRDQWFYEEKNNAKYWRSPALEQLWPFGFSTITDVNFKTAAYVARYVMKKITGDQAKDHYIKIDKKTGEVFEIQPEYNAMSLKPGIAVDWYNKFSSDVFPHDYVIINGQKMKTPSYYLKRLKEQNPGMFEKVKDNRREKGKQQAWNNTDERLAVREICAQSSLNRAERPIE